MPRHDNHIPKSLIILATAVMGAVAVTLAMITAPLLSGVRGDTALAGTRCSGGSGGQATPTPTPTETEDPNPIPPLPNPLESESPTPTPTSTSGGGETERCRSEINIAYNSAQQRFSGAVRSDKAACERGRRVTLKLDRSGKDRTVGTTTTTRRGKWTIPFDGNGKRYYAKAAKRSITRSGGKIVCLGDRSKTIRAR